MHIFILQELNQLEVIVVLNIYDYFDECSSQLCKICYVHLRLQSKCLIHFENLFECVTDILSLGQTMKAISSFFLFAQLLFHKLYHFNLIEVQLFPWISIGRISRQQLIVPSFNIFQLSQLAKDNGFMLWLSMVVKQQK